MSHEWYTPKIYIDAARHVLGTIDLDPASCAQANEIIQATRYYSQEQDGLQQEWHGSVWLNPPYGRVPGRGNSSSYQKLFTEKLLAGYRAGHISQAILLCLGNPGCHWFQSLYRYPLCFVRGTIRFLRPDGSNGHFGFPLSFVYFGEQEQRFAETFRQFGHIVRAVDGLDS